MWFFLPERLAKSPLEFFLTFEYLRRLMAEKQRVLDLGGGPGRYAFRLAADGHRVTLVDLSANNLAFARSKSAELGVSLEDYVHADARSLPFPDESFDAVLALGRFYHLLEEPDRHQAFSECIRLLKPGGLLAVAFISVYAPIYDAALPDPEAIHQWRPRLLEFIPTGRHLAASPSFTDPWFVDPAGIPALVAPYPIETLHIIGAESMLAQSKRFLYAQRLDVLQEWMAFALETAETPASLMGSEHLVYFGRKVGSPG